MLGMIVPAAIKVIMKVPQMLKTVGGLKDRATCFICIAFGNNKIVANALTHCAG